MKFTFDIDPKTSGVNLSIEGGNSLSELQGKFVILNFLKTKLHDKSMSKEEIANCNLCKLKIAINKYLRGEKENQFNILYRSSHIAKKYGDVIHNDFLCSVLQDSNFLIRYRRDYDTEQWYSLVDDLIGEIDEQIVKYFQI